MSEIREIVEDPNDKPFKDFETEDGYKVTEEGLIIKDCDICCKPIYEGDDCYKIGNELYCFNCVSNSRFNAFKGLEKERYNEWQTKLH